MKYPRKTCRRYTININIIQVAAKEAGRPLPRFDIRTLDSIWYNALPLWKLNNMNKPDRDTVKYSALSKVCQKYGVTREELGIIASPWAAMYFEDKWSLVSYD